MPSLLVGSPPRGRGKALLLLDAGVVVGITPAWAGKRRCQLSTYTVVWDHPRVGGEKSGRADVAWLSQGSPPRGRGKVPVQVIHDLLVRITPA